MILLRLAWRNLFRNPRRTALTAAAGAFAAVLTILSLAMAYGSHERWIEEVVRLYPGHFEVSLDGYRENRTLDYGMELSRAAMDGLNALPESDGWAPRLESWGLVVGDEDGATGRAAWVVGVDAEREQHLTSLVSSVERGRFVSPGSGREVVLGETLAKNLGVVEGDNVILLSADYYGSQSADRFRVIGTIEVGNPEFDSYAAFVDLHQLQDFLEMGEGVSHVAVFATDPGRAEPIAVQLAEIFPDESFELLSWEELIPDVIQFMVLDDLGAYLTTGVLIIVVGFGLLNTILMSVFERVREFGVLRALGLRPSAVFKLVMIESLLLSLLGIAIGLALVIPLVLYLEQAPIPGEAMGMSQDTIDAMELFNIDAVIVFKLTMRQVIVVPLILVFVAILAALPPAIKASRGRPVDALREA
ncbi:MAG: ABC transporter permease [bacterium]|nr:ABC transporter permease [bacterium]